MIVDTSVLVAIFASEPEQARFSLALANDDGHLMSAVAWVEFATVLVRKYRVADPAPVQARLTQWLRISIVPVDEPQARAASVAYALFGPGAGHAACLNFGDCFSYALARSTGLPLLFKGDDFNRTDLTLAAASAYPR